MFAVRNVSTTQQLASLLIHIIGTTSDYRSRVDAISCELRGCDDLTARTALLIALASVPNQPLANWSPGR